MGDDRPPERRFEARVEAAGMHKTTSFTASTFDRSEDHVEALDANGHTVYYAERENLVDITLTEE